MKASYENTFKNCFRYPILEDNNNLELPIPPPKRGAQRTPSPLKIRQYDQSSPPQPPSPIKVAPPTTPQSPMRRAPPSPVMHQESPPQAEPPQPIVPMQQQRRSSASVKAISNGEQPLLGADRYEEIIEARGRCSRGSSVISGGPRSVQGSMTNLFQPGTTMAMREESLQRTTASRPSLNKSQPGSMNKLNSGSFSGLNIRPAPAPQPAKVPSPQPLLVKKPGPALTQKSGFIATQIQPSIDPIRPETTEAFRKQHQLVQTSSYPDWLLITLAYSAVFVTILLLSNIIPNGRLYIHFTAFWSLILYFIVDDVDHKSTDVLETVMENFVKVKK